MDNYEQTWDIERDLPWDAVPIGPVSTDNLNEKLATAISLLFPADLNSDSPGKVQARSAAQVFLYLYMLLASDGYRYVVPVLSIHMSFRETDSRVSKVHRCT